MEKKSCEGCLIVSALDFPDRSAQSNGQDGKTRDEVCELTTTKTRWCCALHHMSKDEEVFDSTSLFN